MNFDFFKHFQSRKIFVYDQFVDTSNLSTKERLMHLGYHSFQPQQPRSLFPMEFRPRLSTLVKHQLLQLQVHQQQQQQQRLAFENGWPEENSNNQKPPGLMMGSRGYE